MFPDLQPHWELLNLVRQPFKGRYRLMMPPLREPLNDQLPKVHGLHQTVCCRKFASVKPINRAGKKAVIVSAALAKVEHITSCSG
jgi:hypothetical protein